MIKPIWFGLNWGLHPDRIPATNNQELLRFVINPPLCSGLTENLKTLKVQTSIQLALTLENIWNLRNQVVFNAAIINHLVVVKNLEVSILELFKILNPATRVNNQPEFVSRWSASPPNTLKINVDIAINLHDATLAVVARDNSGSIL
jgi:hypothetical protein